MLRKCLENECVYRTYFGAAFDYLGHTSTSISEGVVVDTTPPVPGTVNIEGLLFHQHVLSRREFRIQWRGFEDPESGLSTVRISVGSVNHSYDVTIMKKYTDSIADIDHQDLVDGCQYHIRFEVCNYILIVNFMYRTACICVL